MRVVPGSVAEPNAEPVAENARPVRNAEPVANAEPAAGSTALAAASSHSPLLRDDFGRADPGRADEGSAPERRGHGDGRTGREEALRHGEGPSPEEIQVPVLENVDRFVTGLITGVPPLLLVLAGWQVWNRELHWRDIAIFAVMYVPVGLGVTIGYHRLFTHRSFKTSAWMRGLLGALGTMSIEGPVISWVADHRKHHAYTDRPGDPHSPHVDRGGGWRGALRGLAHAHVGWLFEHTQRGSRERFAPDLLADPVINFIDKTFVVWSLLGLAIPFGLGVLVGGTVHAGLEAMLWGGAVRILLLHHVTYSINSLCHFFGTRRFDTDDESHNLLWLAPLSFGEAWHNNHHAFPTSAFHGLGRREVDLSGIVISGLERAGLVWDVQRVRPDRQASKSLVA